MPYHKMFNETKKKLARISYLSKVYNDKLHNKYNIKIQNLLKYAKP